MTSFRGTYSCKLDAKGRITFPAQYRRFMTEEDRGSIVIQSRGELTLLGMGPYIEIWPSDEFARRYGKRSTAKEMDSAPEVSKAKGAK